MKNPGLHSLFSKIYFLLPTTFSQKKLRELFATKFCWAKRKFKCLKVIGINA
jgi:hypothetical protein